MQHENTSHSKSAVRIVRPGHRSQTFDRRFSIDGSKLVERKPSADSQPVRPALYAMGQSFPGVREPPFVAGHWSALSFPVVRRGVMPDRYLLERVYRRSDFAPDPADRLEALGQLLRSAIEGPPPNPDLDRLCTRLSEPDHAHVRRGTGSTRKDRNI